MLKRQFIINGSIPMCMGPPDKEGRKYGAMGVYPHVYGATDATEPSEEGHLGLSPCVWGHQILCGLMMRRSGSIPMCMGPPFFALRVAALSWVYPHVYGATSMNF